MIAIYDSVGCGPCLNSLSKESFAPSRFFSWRSLTQLETVETIERAASLLVRLSSFRVVTLDGSDPFFITLILLFSFILPSFPINPGSGSGLPNRLASKHRAED